MLWFYIPSSSFTEFLSFIKRMCHFVSCKSLHLWCYSLQANVQRQKRSNSWTWQASNEVRILFLQTDSPKKHCSSWNTVLSHVLFKFSSYINCLENLGHWRYWGYIVWGFFSFLEMPRREIFFVLTHCTLVSHLTANTLYPSML